ncbi:MAG TPA: GNAT family N-acetyltransferase [Allosphingosinicella sp.]|nr:GNAT family N-acetyltransferase [Allosphingosinicella sp.]
MEPNSHPGDKRVPFHLSPLWWESFAAAFGPLERIDMAGARLHARIARRGIGPMSVRTLQSATNLQTCYFDAEGAGELADLPTRLFARYRADELRFDWLRDDAALLGAAAGWGKTHRVLVQPYAVSPVVDCRESFEAYLARSGKTVRKVWRTCRREVVEGNALGFEIVTGGEGLPALLQEMFALEAAGWKGREGSAMLCIPAEAAFYTRLAHAAAAAGALRIALLREGERLIAFEYCIVSDGIVAAMKVGYDEQRTRLQPGHVLALLNIRDACANPALDYYDMLGNSMRIADYKRKFATDYWTISRVRLFAPTAAGLALHAFHKARPAARALRDRARRLVARLRR